MKASPNVTTPEEYLASIPPERREIPRILHSAILDAAPGLVAGICYGMIGYGLHPYRTQSGCEGEWFKVGLANQKNYVSLYICECDGDEYLVEKHRNELGWVSTGKSCIRIKRLDDLNLEAAMNLVKRAAES